MSVARLRRVPPEPRTGWEAELQLTSGGKLTKSVGNVALILIHHPVWQGSLTYDAWWDRLSWTRSPDDETGLRRPQAGEPFGDAHLVYLQHWIDRHYGTTFSLEGIMAAVRHAADVVAIHPVKSYLDALVWDGTPRLCTWLTTYLGTPDGPYETSTGVRWMISAVARIYEPGPCQVDHVLVLEGKQGAGKSSTARILGGPWYLPALPALNKKDEVATALIGRWIVELAELDVLKGIALSRMNAFITETSDVYRPKYGKCAVERWRQCVFMGTTNERRYLHDATGGRRFWGVRTGERHPIDLPALKEARDQLWAEAVRLYRDGEQWWPPETDTPLLQAQQEQRFLTDEWENRVAAWLDEHADITEISGGDLLDQSLNIPARDWTPALQIRAGILLGRLGWDQQDRKRIGGRYVRLWVRPAPPAP